MFKYCFFARDWNSVFAVCRRSGCTLTVSRLFRRRVVDAINYVPYSVQVSPEELKKAETPKGADSTENAVCKIRELHALMISKDQECIFECAIQKRENRCSGYDSDDEEFVAKHAECDNCRWTESPSRPIPGYFVEFEADVPLQEMKSTLCGALASQKIAEFGYANLQDGTQPKAQISMSQKRKAQQEQGSKKVLVCE